MKLLKDEEKQLNNVNEEGKKKLLSFSLMLPTVAILR